MEGRACILGATGLIGSNLLELLLSDNRYTEVMVYTRKPTGIEHPKLAEKVGDLLDEDFFKDPIFAEHIFCCIGTTQSKTPDMSVYKQIDFGIPVNSAHAGLRGGMKKFLVVSSLGANASSKMFYPRIKGQMEETLQKMDIPGLHIFRPSMLLGKREETRFGETVGRAFVKFFSPLIPSRYKGVEAGDVARAMLKVATADTGKGVYESDEIRKMLS